MKYKFLVFILLFNLVAFSQNLEVVGKVKISDMDLENNADSVVVKMPDGTLAIRNASSLMEYQILSISNDTIFLSNGSFVKLPFDGNWNNLSGIPSNVDHPRYTDVEAVSAGTAAGFLTEENDGSITNELQTISRNGLTVSLSNGGGTFQDSVNAPQNLANVLMQGNDAYSNLITNLGDPVNGQDAATKAYVDLLKQEIEELQLATGIKIKDIDGNIYRTLQLGDQVWMAENLRTTRYNDGTLLSQVLDNTTWGGLSTPAYCWYNSDPDSLGFLYGALYNFPVVADTNTHNICPEGWDIPTESDWNALITYLTNNGYGYEGSGSDIAKSLASSSGWDDSMTPGTVGNDQAANNSSRFSGLPGGFRTNDGEFVQLGFRAFWWTSDQPMPFYERFALLGSNETDLQIYGDGMLDGFSVRCLKQ